MIEKISNLAERLATTVSESRRGFLVRAGQAALGVAGVLGGLLARSEAAHASRTGYCEIQTTPTGSHYYSGTCVSVADCAYGTSNMCRGGAPRPSASACRSQYG